MPRLKDHLRKLVKPVEGAVKEIAAAGKQIEHDVRTGLQQARTEKVLSGETEAMPKHVAAATDAETQLNANRILVEQANDKASTEQVEAAKVETAAFDKLRSDIKACIEAITSANTKLQAAVSLEDTNTKLPDGTESRHKARADGKAAGEQASTAANTLAQLVPKIVPTANAAIAKLQAEVVPADTTGAGLEVKDKDEALARAKAEAEGERKLKLEAKANAEAEKKRADEAASLATAKDAEAEAQRKRAEAAIAELAQLKAQIGGLIARVPAPGAAPAGAPILVARSAAVNAKPSHVAASPSPSLAAAAQDDDWLFADGKEGVPNVGAGSVSSAASASAKR